jgi:hypothetical protein
MKSFVYIETSVFGYLAMRPSTQLVTAAKQQVTPEFWEDYREKFNLFVSLAVVDECGWGDATAAAERGLYLDRVPILGVDKAV